MTTRVFISYAKEDKDVAKKLYTDLQQGGVEPWLDSVNLLPGQAWETAIRKAISDSSYFIAILSSRSVGKKGYVQKEIRQALAIAEEYPDDRIFIVPVRIDECEPSFEGLRRLHRADLFSSYEKVVKDLLRVFNYESEEKEALIEVDIRKKVGTISKLTDKGFGFISREEGGKDLTFHHGERPKDGERRKDLFFHHGELRGITFEELHEGDVVLFSIAQGPKGQIAVDVIVVSFSDIEAQFDRVFGFIQRDLERFLAQDVGGNFAVTALAACACETLARYRYGSGEGRDVFRRLLPDGPFQVIARSLFDLLRNGLVHRYDTADIRVEGRVIRLALSWRAEPHLSVKDIDGVPNLILNVTKLCADLFSAFDEYREELKGSAEARDRFFRTYRETGTFDVNVPAQVEAWKALVKDAFR